MPVKTPTLLPVIPGLNDLNEDEMGSMLMVYVSNTDAIMERLRANDATGARHLMLDMLDEVFQIGANAACRLDTETKDAELFAFAKRGGPRL